MDITIGRDRFGRKAYFVGKRAHFYSRKKAEARLAELEGRVSSSTKRKRRSTPVYVAPQAMFPVLGGGVIRTVEETVKQRPFVVVEVEPGKNRAFYMSTGTGGETGAGEWNLFGGIAGGGLNGLGWFIKPTGGKRVAKYADVSAWLAKRFSTKVSTAWARIRAMVPHPKAFDEAPLAFARKYIIARVTRGPAYVQLQPARREMRRVLGAAVNDYLARLGAIAKVHVDAYADVLAQAKQPQTVAIAPRAR